MYSSSIIIITTIAPPTITNELLTHPFNSLINQINQNYIRSPSLQILKLNMSSSLNYPIIINIIFNQFSLYYYRKRKDYSFYYQSKNKKIKKMMKQNQKMTTTINNGSNSNTINSNFNNKIEIQTLDGAPIDFSFKNIRSLNQIFQETISTNLGTQPVEQQKIVEQKKNVVVEQQIKQNVPVQTKLQIVRTIEMTQNKILDANKNSTKQKEKQQKKQVKVIKPQASALFLRYNKITSIQGLFQAAEKLFPKIQNLMWIDLSHNRLTNLVQDFARFPQLKNIYLHANYISEFKQIQKLQQVKKLRSITIHANPLQKYGEFRVIITYILPQLQKIDSTLLTKREHQRAKILCVTTGGSKNAKFKYPIIKNFEQRPQQSDNQEEA